MRRAVSSAGRTALRLDVTAVPFPSDPGQQAVAASHALFRGIQQLTKRDGPYDIQGKQPQPHQPLTTHEAHSPSRGASAGVLEPLQLCAAVCMGLAVPALDAGGLQHDDSVNSVRAG